MAIPSDVRELLRKASEEAPTLRFSCQILDDPSNQFVELWAPRIHAFVYNALGPYGTGPLPVIHKIEDGHHTAGATASFDISSGQISLATSVNGNFGVILEKLTHEMTHGSLAKFPEGDPFYEEGFVDFSVWVMSHAPIWSAYRDLMIAAAADNIRNRRERALRGGSDYDRKRWAGGLYASTAYGPYIIAILKQKKLEGNLTW